MKYLLTISIILTSYLSIGQTGPKEWVGEYQGTMILGFLNRPNDSIPVDFEMKELIEDSVWSYTMNYHSSQYGEMTKDYRIIAVKKCDTKNFLLDELNGIKMEMTLMNGTMYGMYDVLGSTFITTMHETQEGLYFELFMSSRAKPMITRTTPSETIDREDQEAPIEAKSFKPVLHQTVLLHRK